MEDYWSLYVSLLVMHTGLTIATISLGGTDMVIGLRRPRHGIGAGAMVAGVSLHRRLGKFFTVDIWRRAHHGVFRVSDVVLLVPSG
ncbi:MAG: hypothetical protein VST67_05805 [Nitrospirota bacterium]|nr:hypothetical protein [Nitrospirota bacterium]